MINVPPVSRSTVELFIDGAPLFAARPLIRIAVACFFVYCLVRRVYGDDGCGRGAAYKAGHCEDEKAKRA